MTDSAQTFDQSARVYDLLYGDKDTEGEVRWLSHRLFAHGIASDAKVLELGAGTGRHARGLADLGFSVTAVDPSDQMLESALPHERVTFLQGNGQDFRADSSFDAVLALFHVVSYQTTLSAVSAFFETASHHLRSGGLFGFDTWYSPAVNHMTPESRSLVKENESLRVTREATPTEDVMNSRVDVHYRYTVHDLTSNSEQTFDEVHAMRHFSYGEIQMLGAAHGFTIADAREFMTDSEPGRNTWGVWFELEKE